MMPAVRIAVAFVASLAAAGLVQQASMAAARVREPLEALPPLALLVILLTAILALPAWRRPAAIGLTAGLLLTLLAVVGAGGYCLGFATRTPGVGGNILYLIARFVDLYFILPAMIAVAVLWLLLRSARRSAWWDRSASSERNHHCAGGAGFVCAQLAPEHDPEKWKAVFPKRSCSIKKPEREIIQHKASRPSWPSPRAPLLGRSTSDRA
jgi:hypothetical protein